MGHLALQPNSVVSLAAYGTIKSDNEIISHGTIDLGQHALTIEGNTRSLTLENDSKIIFGSDGSAVTGKINAPNLTSVTFNDDSNIQLVEVAGDPEFWQNRELMTIASSGTYDGWENLDLRFYNLADPAATGVLKTSDETNSFDAVIAGKSKAVGLTPNISAGAAAMNRILANPAAQDLALDLKSAVVKIKDGGYSPAVEQAAFKQLVGESLVNVTQSVSTTVLQTQGVVFNRLDRVREIEINNLTPPAAGDGNELNRIWAGGFGVWASEDDSPAVFGYDYSGGGIALGYDREVPEAPGLRVGVSGAYSSGRLNNNDGRTTVDLSTVGIGAYGSYLLPNNVFVDASVAYAHTQNDYETNVIQGGAKSGTFNVNSWMLGARGGYIFTGGGFQVIPSLGLKYVYLRQGSFADTLSAAAMGNTVANAYRSRTDSQVDIPLQVKVNTALQAGSAILTPELRAGYNFAVEKLDNAMSAGFAGSAESYEITGTRPRGNSFQAGAGLKVNTGGSLDVFVNYDLDAAKNYLGHSASLGLGFEF
jgi:outer membrane autotransporter protein